MKWTNSKTLAVVIIGFLMACSPNQQENTYRDLNKNGKMDIYEDKSQPVEARVNDLLAQMTLEEKAGTMFINGAFVNEDGTIEKKRRRHRLFRHAALGGRKYPGKKNEPF